MIQDKVPVVRLADPIDEADILAMCKRLHVENGLFTLNEAKVQECLKKHYERRGVIVGVIGSPGQIQASTCLELSTFYYSDDAHLAELWNFVDEPYRRSHNAEALISFGKVCAEKMKMPLFTGVITNRQMAGKVRLYRRMLGYPTGAFFVYNGSWKTEPMADHAELRERLRVATVQCANGQVKSRDAAKKLSSLLRAATAAIDEIDNLWGNKSKPEATLNV